MAALGPGPDACSSSTPKTQNRLSPPALHFQSKF
ncbi:hypothetical protein COLO4_22566 [Corchorus olitorius]|uniref:Uncharacterized protein n=1 Tax=Corchorus olitorius TaxID=93759 RepID=A0A1R3ILF6_9ROSI|nr:hypothetical protein COLO4_22566 [Corchorus olitorius]